MPPPPRPRRFLLPIVVLLALLGLLLLIRCAPWREVEVVDAAQAPASGGMVSSVPVAAPPEESAPESPRAEEVLTTATLQAPAEVAAGAVFTVGWTGPNNARDFVTIVPVDAAANIYLSYADTRGGSPAGLTAPIDPGDYEARYVTGQSRTVLARAPVRVQPVKATLEAPATAVAGAAIPIRWSGPNNAGDYVTVVPADTRDSEYRNYAYTKDGPLAQVAALDPGRAEVRYVTGQGARVLARRPILITAPLVTLEAAPEVVAGGELTVVWTGPDHGGDYLTIVPVTAPDGRYANYTNTTKGSPLTITAPIDSGPAEVRYQTGPGARVLARRPVLVRAAEITLEAPTEVPVAGAITVRWTGPNHPRDYITLVPVGTPDGQYQNYTDTARGSPLTVTAPREPMQAELRYMSGQGARVLARRPIRIVAAP